MNRLPLFLLSAFCIGGLRAQETPASGPLRFSGYMETYYVYDFGNPANHNRPDFLYSFNRHNEVNLNLAFLKAEFEQERTRGKLALMTGTYANANLAAEPGTLKNIFEANAGLRLSKTEDLWLDAGVFASHIGFESAIGADCWNMTRSILAENSPYYLSGARISWTSADARWFLSGSVLNDWQRIQRVPGAQLPAFGHQLTWKPNDRITLNSSSFIGSDTPGDARQMRFFHNFYGQFQVGSKWGIITGFDIGAQQQAKGSSAGDVWYAPVFIARFAPSEKVSLAVRAEYFSDPGQAIIGTGTSNGFQTSGYSLNFDLRVARQVLWRIEGRSFLSRDKIFSIGGAPANFNIFIGSSISTFF